MIASGRGDGSRQMTLRTELWVDRRQLRKTQVVTADVPALRSGEVLVEIDKFGLTANNVSYAVTGDTIGYWGFFPAEGSWGKVPVWGCASVIESTCPDVPEGERLWGFFPMASHAVLQPGKVREDQFVDVAEHRRELPALYNTYRRTRAEPDFLQQMEVERCLLFPLLATSWLIYDFLRDNGFFGAQQVLIGSASSKTGAGLAEMLHADPAVSQRVVGLTSAANLPFVESLGCCEEVVTYGQERRIDADLPAAYVDMSGDAGLTRTLHQLLGENMVNSTMVGATHWEQGGETGDLPGAEPTFFFAPAQIGKRDGEWGPGMAMAKAMAASAEVAKKWRGDLEVEWTRGADDLAGLWAQLLDNQVSPRRGQMVSLL
jgi:NADPH:quinone reductase-like Zn-dependent oxidoreductase